MFTHRDELIGAWSGAIVHRQAATPLHVYVDKVGDDGAVHGTYSFPSSHPVEPGGQFTGYLSDASLFINLSADDPHGEMHFHLQIVGENGPEMIFGALPTKDHKTLHATVTVFPEKQAKRPIEITGLWQIFFDGDR